MVNTERSDTGKYTCEASNGVGTPDRRTAQLTVTGEYWALHLLVLEACSMTMLSPLDALVGVLKNMALVFKGMDSSLDNMNLINITVE